MSWLKCTLDTFNMEANTMDPDQTGGKRVHDILHFPDDAIPMNLPINCPENVVCNCCIYSNAL